MKMQSAQSDAPASAGGPRDCLLVAHGAPADPGPQEGAMRALAAAVAGLLPGWRVGGATLAAPGALEAALAGMRAPLIYPFFMGDGWFTASQLPRRLAQAGAAGWTQLAPFGADPGLARLIAAEAAHQARRHGRAVPETALLIVAHGSGRSAVASRTAREMAATLDAQRRFRRVVAGFIEEAPFLADAARGLGPALCLPFFALSAGHVTHDIPEALAKAGFDGPILAPIGAQAAVPALIAASLAEAARDGAAP